MTVVDVLTRSHGLSESYSPQTRCSSCISVCRPSLGHGAVAERVPSGYPQGFSTISKVQIMFLSVAQSFISLNLQLSDVKFFDCVPVAGGACLDSIVSGWVMLLI